MARYRPIFRDLLVQHGLIDPETGEERDPNTPAPPPPQADADWEDLGQTYGYDEDADNDWAAYAPPDRCPDCGSDQFGPRAASVFGTPGTVEQYECTRCGVVYDELGEELRPSRVAPREDLDRVPDGLLDATKINEQYYAWTPPVD